MLVGGRCLLGMSATAAGCGPSVGMSLKGVEIMNRVIFYKTATCRCMGAEKAMEPGNEVKAIIVKEVAR